MFDRILNTCRLVMSSLFSKAPCKSCSTLEHRNEYLEEQVVQLTEDIENIKELQRNAMRYAYYFTATRRLTKCMKKYVVKC